ncbi:hypothetical protein N8I71_11340 [Roseibacterium sp. SDUM158016]|uniref:DUF6544 family protein n=1 Tax=Roseicyclus sediminis TaxID=2980997 RepID=UPI0021D31DAF|nr:DUF6544 family protein [Roseibacterium sp. SDUM158016]MCU4653431.1 hypothetical protein [Roseibacterium sp. SDUM158016]
MKIVLFLLAALCLCLLALGILRFLDWRGDRQEWQRLAALQPAAPPIYGSDRVAGLPDPARRYFGFTIAEGTPLLPVAEIDMGGRFSLGTKEAPNYQPMEARQILAAPEGFVWSVRLRGGMPISGSDTGTWMRFRILGLVPVVRVGGTDDHRRSAFARFAAEAVFWSPAALLPGPGVTWSELDEDTARVTLRRGDLEQAVDVTVDAEGRPLHVSMQRWTDANPEKVHRLQPFGGYLSDFREVGGYRLPFRVEAGNMFGTDAYFPFFLAEVTDIRFPPPE